MFPITEIPPVVSGVSSFFSALFNKQQLKHFREYETGLIVSSNKTIQAINSLFLEGNDQSSLNKFLTQSDWDEEELNNKRLELLQTKEKTRWKHYGIIAIDDTIAHKTGKDMEGADWFYDHSSGKNVLGHNIVTAHYIDNMTGYPIDYRLYYKEGSEFANKEGFKTKIQLALELIKDCIDRKIPVNVFVFDRWFLCTEIEDFLKAHGKSYICPLKGNRLAMRDGIYIPVKDFLCKIDENDFREVRIGRKKFRTWTKRTRLPKTGKVRLVISYELDEEGKKKDEMPSFFVTNLLDWEPVKILKTYMMRWNIEAFYRDSKQELGLEGYQVRKIRAIKRHWYLVFTAYSLLKLGFVHGGFGKAGKRMTIGEKCRSIVMGSLKSFVGWVYGKFRNMVKFEEVMELLALKIAKV